MPDTKAGREKKGRNKESQLDAHLNRKEIQSLDRDDEPPRWDGTTDEFLADELPDE